MFCSVFLPAFYCDEYHKTPCHGNAFRITGSLWAEIYIHPSPGHGWFPSQRAKGGITKSIPPFRYFPHFSTSPRHTLAIGYRVYIWLVSSQLSCDDSCQIWTWFKESNRYFRKIENFTLGEINERSFSHPHPRSPAHKRPVIRNPSFFL